MLTFRATMWSLNCIMFTSSSADESPDVVLQHQTLSITNNDNIIIIIADNVYGAVIMT